MEISNRTWLKFDEVGVYSLLGRDYRGPRLACMKGTEQLVGAGTRQHLLLFHLRRVVLVIPDNPVSVYLLPIPKFFAFVNWRPTVLLGPGLRRFALGEIRHPEHPLSAPKAAAVLALLAENILARPRLPQECRSVTKTKKSNNCRGLKDLLRGERTESLSTQTISNC